MQTGEDIFAPQRPNYGVGTMLGEWCGRKDRIRNEATSEDQLNAAVKFSLAYRYGRKSKFLRGCRYAIETHILRTSQ